MNSKTQDIKKLSQPTKKTNKTKQDSSTEVNTVFSGPRVVFGARVSKKLKEQFVEVAKREYGSVCRLQEALMAAVLAVTPLKVNSSKTITIQKIVIERNLRPRRYATATARDYGEVKMVVEDVGSWQACYHCGERPCFVGFNSDRDNSTRVFACEEHFQKSNYEGWRPLW
jgi:hypothetical protein